MIASAQSTDIQSQIQALLAQIKALQEQIKTLVASTSAGSGMGWGMGSSTNGMPVGQMGKQMCITLSRNLRQGDSGDDVTRLQQMLAQDPSSGFTVQPSGYFGPITMKAMMHFQMNNGIASSTDGSVGPLTRGFFERRCGKGLDGMQGDRMGGGQGGPGMMQAGVRGTISANNTTNIVVTTDNGSVTANVSASTTIKVFAGTSTPPTAGTVADLVVGKKVAVMGPKNSDGSIEARDIAVGDVLPMMPPPQMNNGMGQGGPGPNGMMPTLNGPQGGPGTNGYGPQNW
jgi:peptidoglycan hydrolase-like protein with peptidoglycan-binding domain